MSPIKKMIIINVTFNSHSKHICVKDNIGYMIWEQWFYEYNVKTEAYTAGNTHTF